MAVKNKLKILTMVALSAIALGITACSESVPSAGSPVSIRTEPATANRVFQNNPDTVTLIDLALIFAYFQAGPNATPETIIASINSLLDEDLTLADFDEPLPTYDFIAGFVVPADELDLNDVAVCFAVQQGASGEVTTANAVAQLTRQPIAVADIISSPCSVTASPLPSPSPSPSASPTAPPLPMPDPGQTFTLFVNPNASSIGNGSEAAPFKTVAAANTFADSVQNEVTNVDVVISVVAPGEEEVSSPLTLSTGSEPDGTRTVTSVNDFTINIVDTTFEAGPDTSVISTDFVVESKGTLRIGDDSTFTGASTVNIENGGIVEVLDNAVVTATSFVGASDNSGTLVTVSGDGDIVFNDVNFLTGEDGKALDVESTDAAGSFTYTTGVIEIVDSVQGRGILAASMGEVALTDLSIDVGEDGVGVNGNDQMADLVINGSNITIGDSSDSSNLATTAIGVIIAAADSSFATITNSTFEIVGDDAIGINLDDTVTTNDTNDSAVIEGSTFNGTPNSAAIRVRSPIPPGLLVQYEKGGNAFNGFGINGAIQQK